MFSVGCAGICGQSIPKSEHENHGNRSKRVTSKQPESKENAKSIVERTLARRLSNPAYFLEPSLNPGNFYSHYREMHYRDADKQG